MLFILSQMHLLVFLISAVWSWCNERKILPRYEFGSALRVTALVSLCFGALQIVVLAIGLFVVRHYIITVVIVLTLQSINFLVVGVIWRDEVCRGGIRGINTSILADHTGFARRQVRRCLGIVLFRSGLAVLLGTLYFR